MEASCREPKMEQPLRFGNRAEWRRWLEDHHAAETEAWLLLSKKAVPGGLHYLEALEEALCVGWIDGRLRAHDATGFTLRFGPRRPASIWSESNRERAARLIREGRMRSPGLARIEEAKRSGAWASAVRPSRTPRMPRDLRDALQADPKAWSNFRAWEDSYRAASIRWVLAAKKEETRTKRIRRIVQRAAQNRRPGIEGF